MSIRNKVIATVFLDDRCSQKDGEVSRSWRPVNFDIYSDLFPDMIYEAIDEWLSENMLTHNVTHELILAHVREHDAGGALTSEYFEVINHEAEG